MCLLLHYCVHSLLMIKLQFNGEELKLNVMFCCGLFCFSGTLMLQVDGFPTGDGVKVKAQVVIIKYNNTSPVCSV